MGARRTLAAAVGAVAALLCVVSDLTLLRSVVVLGASCTKVADPSVASQCQATGASQHGYALVVIGAALAALVTLSLLRPHTARPVGWSMVALGLCVLAIAVVGDIPSVATTGVVGASFSDARGVAGPGLYLELVGGGLAVVAGLATVSAARVRPQSPVEGPQSSVEGPSYQR